MKREISCEEVISVMSDYIDQELEQALISGIDHHLEHCRECFSRAEFEKLLRKRVSDSVEESVPKEVEERIKTLMKQF